MGTREASATYRELRESTGVEGRRQIQSPRYREVRFRGGLQSPVVNLPESAKEPIRTGALGHLVTTNRDGSPQVTCVWVAVEGDELSQRT